MDEGDIPARSPPPRTSAASQRTSSAATRPPCPTHVSPSPAVPLYHKGPAPSPIHHPHQTNRPQDTTLSTIQPQPKPQTTPARIPSKKQPPKMTSKAAPYQQNIKEGADLPREAPPGQVGDPSYKTRGTESVPVVDDDAPLENPMKMGQADSDRQLGMSFFCFVVGWIWFSEVKLDLPCVCLARGVREGCHADCHWGTERDDGQGEYHEGADSPCQAVGHVSGAVGRADGIDAVSG
jgi:hypothetical protein